MIHRFDRFHGCSMEKKVISWPVSATLLLCGYILICRSLLRRHQNVEKTGSVCRIGSVSSRFVLVVVLFVVVVVIIMKRLCNITAGGLIPHTLPGSRSMKIVINQYTKDHG
ncbi:hypothetical protein B0H65DRAFT_463004 [Neurospora tetraspora]|uniref:Uncharacterized protein n=1 Tax=Neurospora tetraspora TaxID=94610 RepID=A0AAE0JI77_9PEZI|nr:hypothetical protein B0H65DRAFT_463004 [Neurospora tetraspora]